MPSIVVDVYKNPAGLKFQPFAYAYAGSEKSSYSNCRGAIVFLSSRNNCVYKWLVEIRALDGDVGSDWK